MKTTFTSLSRTPQGVQKKIALDVKYVISLISDQKSLTCEFNLK